MSADEQENQELVVSQSRSNSVLTTLKNNQVLTTQDWADLESSKEFIKECFVTIPMYRPLPVKIFGVLNDNEHGTPESKLWQCRVEAEVHADQLIEDIHNLEMIRINMDRAEYSLIQMQKSHASEKDENKKAEIDFDMRELKVTLSKLEYRGIKLQKQIKYRIEEVHEWKKISEGIEAAHEGIETKSYVKQYVNNMKFNLLRQKKTLQETEDAENKEDELKHLDSQIASFDVIIGQMESIKNPSTQIGHQTDSKQ